jgi:hypothetical protein
MPSNQFFSEEEAEEILRLAVGRSTAAGGVSRESLMQSAAELGISYEALAEAESQVMDRRRDQEEAKEFRQVQRAKFSKGLWEYLTWNAVLLAINFWHAGRPTWALAVAFFWGIAVVIEFFGTFFPSSSSYQEAFEKWKKKRRKKEARPQVPNELLDRLVLEHDNLNKFEAIKLVREETGMDLKDSKDAVDRYLAQRPDAFA